jgi:2,4-dienoyl-CoA reductase-like NADH-dependent reductase (Old Yellow Enzyme family)
MVKLFEPFQIRSVTLKNRICVSPMSQYRAKEGFVNDWHFSHLSRFALGGCGLVFTEATAISAEGRRTLGDLGLWNDDQIEGMSRITTFLKAEGSIAGIQLSHAGRKASERRPWHGDKPLDMEDIEIRGEHPWVSKGPTNQPYGDAWPTTQAMTDDDINQVIKDFGLAAARADKAGFDVIEVYAAHGFLLHQFYSPLCNTREDSWGGDFNKRIKLSIEVAKSIRKNWPEEKALVFRISATDWIDGGWNTDDSIKLAQVLKASGVDIIDCSSGGIGGPHPLPHFPLAPAFQANLAEAVRNNADIASIAVGLIWEAESANAVIESGKADLVALGRELLNNPNWALHAAETLKADDKYSMWDPAFGWWLNKRERMMQKLGLR